MLRAAKSPAAGEELLQRVRIDSGPGRCDFSFVGNLTEWEDFPEISLVGEESRSSHQRLDSESPPRYVSLMNKIIKINAQSMKPSTRKPHVTISTGLKKNSPKHDDKNNFNSLDEERPRKIIHALLKNWILSEIFLEKIDFWSIKSNAVQRAWTFDVFRVVARSKISDSELNADSNGTYATLDWQICFEIRKPKKTTNFNLLLLPQQWENYSRSIAHWTQK